MRVRLARTLTIAIVLTCLGPWTAFAEAVAGELFRKCADTTGRAYVDARNAWVSAGGEVPHGGADDGWRLRSTAMILQAWRDNTDAYRAYTAPRSHRDEVDKADTTLVSRPSQLPDEAIPLLYEFVLKGSTTPLVRVRAAQALVYLHRHGHPVEVEMLTAALRDTGNIDGATRNFVAEILTTLPIGSISPSTTMELIGRELERGEPHRPVVVALLDGLVLQVKGTSRSEREAMVRRLSDMEHLQSVVGDLHVTYAMGDIGGESGVEAAARLLETAAAPGQRRWAIDALGREGSPSAAEQLLEFASSTARPWYLRRRALERLQQCDTSGLDTAKIQALEAELL